MSRSYAEFPILTHRGHWRVSLVSRRPRPIANPCDLKQITGNREESCPPRVGHPSLHPNLSKQVEVVHKK